MITFYNTYFIYIFAYLFIPLIIFYKSRLYKPRLYNENLFEKKSFDNLKGICAIMVVLAHFTEKMQYPLVMMPFYDVGYVAVGLFFFMSGYGLTISNEKNKQYLNNFLSKRLIRVYLPFVLTNIFAVALFYFFKNKIFSMIDLAEFVLGIKLIDGVTWYVVIMILFYLLFYLVFKHFKKNTSVKLVLLFSVIYFITCYLLKLQNFWYNTSFNFALGVVFATNNKKIIEALKNNYTKIVTLSIVGFSLAKGISLINRHYGFQLPYVFFNAISAVFFTLVVLVFIFKVEIKSRVVLFIGAISYEIYLFHMKLFVVFFNENKIANGLSFYLFILTLLILSILFSYIDKFILNKSKILSSKIVRH